MTKKAKIIKEIKLTLKRKIIKEAKKTETEII